MEGAIPPRPERAGYPCAFKMNRRFYCQGLWFSVMSLNTEYVRQASDRMLTFVLDHEFEMG